MTKREKLTATDEDGNEVVIPSKYEVCGRCKGHGTHDHPAFSNGFTSSEWAEMDQDSRDNYMSGAYDVMCTECDGQRVVLVPDFDNMTDELREIVEAEERAEREIRAAQRMERMMGC